MTDVETQKPRIVGIGETVADLILQEDGNFKPVVGGTPLNVVVGLSRQGFRTAIISPVQKFGFGEKIREHLTKSLVDTSLLVETSAETTIAIITFDEENEPQYQCYIDGTSQASWQYDDVRQPRPGDILVVSGSIALSKEPMSSVIDDVFTYGPKYHTVIFDPNIRPAVIGDDRDLAITNFEKWASKSTIVKASEKDLHWLYPDKDLGEIAAELIASGTTMVTITDGAGGAYAFTSSGAKAHSPATALGESEIADTVGAGDTYNAAMIEWLIKNGIVNSDPEHDKAAIESLTEEQLEKMTAFAVERATEVCKVVGANPPWKKGLGPAPVNEFDQDSWSEATRGR